MKIIRDHYRNTFTVFFFIRGAIVLFLRNLFYATSEPLWRQSVLCNINRLFKHSDNYTWQVINHGRMPAINFILDNNFNKISLSQSILPWQMIFVDYWTQLSHDRHIVILYKGIHSLFWLNIIMGINLFTQSWLEKKRE